MRETNHFMAFEITPRKVSKSRPSEQSSGNVDSQQSLPQYYTPATWTHDPGFDTICWIKPLTISSENQLVSSKGSQILLWHLKSHLARYLRVVQVSKAAALLNLNKSNVWALLNKQNWFGFVVDTITRVRKPTSSHTFNNRITQSLSTTTWLAMGGVTPQIIKIPPLVIYVSQHKN